MVTFSLLSNFSIRFEKSLFITAKHSAHLLMHKWTLTKRPSSGLKLKPTSQSESTIVALEQGLIFRGWIIALSVTQLASLTEVKSLYTIITAAARLTCPYLQCQHDLKGRMEEVNWTTWSACPHQASEDQYPRAGHSCRLSTKTAQAIRRQGIRFLRFWTSTHKTRNT